MTQTLKSTRFGDVELADDALVEFPNGLIGLSGNRYGLIPHGEAERIGVTDPAQAEVFVTVRAAEDRNFSANLRAPIIIADGRGFQVINEADDAPVRAPLF